MHTHHNPAVAMCLLITSILTVIIIQKKYKNTFAVK